MRLFAGTTLLFAFSLLPSAQAYSVLTHEAIIDAAWDDSIRPLLLKRFAGSTPEELRRAHASAYGGVIIQDAGYYPFGNKFFSDLLHYVRSGDFIAHLLEDAQTLNEYAFALGALAHMAADTEGHTIAVNHVVPELYPKLMKKYGKVIPYDLAPIEHLQVEFAFDVTEVAQNHYAPDAYHDFIGFEVERPLLTRAFHETYSLDFDSLFLSADLALGTYRYTVSGLIPLMTKVAWQTKRKEIEALAPGVTRRRFIYNLSRASYRKDWGDKYQRPGPGARFLAFLFRLLPKVGPLRPFQFRPLTPRTEQLFASSFNATLSRYRTLLGHASDGTLKVANVNFDTGKAVEAGEYRLADETYAKLTGKLADGKFTDIDPKLKADILAYYSNPAAAVETKKRPEDWRKLQGELEQLRNGTGGAGVKPPAR